MEVSILNGLIAVGALLTPKTLRIAKALGYAAGLRDCGDNGSTDPVAHDVRQRVEAARFAHHSAVLSRTGNTGETGLDDVRSLIAWLPRPLLVVSVHPHRTAALLATAIGPNGGEIGPHAGSDPFSMPLQHGWRAA